MNSIFAWQVFDEDGEWGNIAAMIFPGAPAPSPLITRNEQVAREWFGPLAQAHGKASDMPIRLARYDLAEVLEEG